MSDGKGYHEYNGSLVSNFFKQDLLFEIFSIVNIKLNE